MLEALHRQPALSRLVSPDSQPPAPHVSGERLLSGAGGVLEGGPAGPSSSSSSVSYVEPRNPRPTGARFPSPARRAPAPRPARRAVLEDIATALTRWLGGRAIAMAMVGVVVTVGLYALKIPLAGILGVMAAWLTFIECLGAIASAAPALLCSPSPEARASSWEWGCSSPSAHLLSRATSSPRCSPARRFAFCPPTPSRRRWCWARSSA